MPSLDRKQSHKPLPAGPVVIDQGVPSSDDARVPRWLIYSYCILPIAGFIFLYFFWDGSFGWFDRGAWGALQQAANTK